MKIKVEMVNVIHLKRENIRERKDDKGPRLLAVNCNGEDL